MYIIYISICILYNMIFQKAHNFLYFAIDISTGQELCRTGHISLK